MNTASILIVAVMVVLFTVIVVLITATWICQRKADKQLKKHHSTYFTNGSRTE